MILAADSEGPDQTAYLRSLIWTFTAHARPEGTFSLERLASKTWSEQYHSAAGPY